MLSAHKIAANRRNAKKSTGPRTTFGRQRASRNAYRHGLAARLVLSAVAAKQVEKLARKIAGANPNALTLEWARSAAEAMLDLSRLRRIKMGLLERAAPAEIPGPRAMFSVDPEPRPAHNTAAQYQSAASECRKSSLAHTIPPEGREQNSKAILQNLSELQALERYERRIFSRRDRAIRQIAKRRKPER